MHNYRLSIPDLTTKTQSSHNVLEGPRQFHNFQTYPPVKSGPSGAVLPNTNPPNYRDYDELQCAQLNS